jgi:uncharacterized protein with ParB-like and HNH nuclease domain
VKAEENKLTRFLEGHDRKFIIPVYQRNYDWRIEHCKKLYEDLLDISRCKRKSHFFGSIVYIYNDDSNGQEFIIIDGQQRITTVSLLLLALINVIKILNIKDKDIDIDVIKNEYLFGRYSGKEKIKLKSVKEDNEAFVKLFETDEKEKFILPSNITGNYLYFKERLLKESIDFSDFLNSIKKLNIVEIKLKKEEDDPQLIFESLNSTGLDLKEADKVRNFLLMDLEYKKQEEFYNKYWINIEKYTKFNVSNFIRDYITCKEKKAPKKDNVYFEFKEFFNNNYEKEKLKDLLEELLEFSKYYNYILSANYNNTSSNNLVNEYLYYLLKLEVSVSYPFLLEVFHDFYKEEYIKENDITELLKIIESYIFRRIICDLPANSLNKIFISLARDIKKHNNYKTNYIEILKFILIQKKGNQRFPNDHEFKERLISKDVYNFNKKNKLHLLERLENYNNKEKIDIQKLLDNDELSIEHILPQTLSASWKKTLGDKYQEIYDKFINTIGNITLTAYNSKYSNKPFPEKKNMEHGFNESKLYLNEYLKKIDIWNEDSILKRANILADKAVNIWSYSKTSYIYNKSIDNIYSLDEENDFSGQKIKYFEFMGERYEVNSWSNFYEKMCLLLFDLEPTKFKSFLLDNDFKNKLSKNENGLRRPIKISGDVFVESNLNVGAITSNIILMLEKLGLSTSDVSVGLKEQ